MAIQYSNHINSFSGSTTDSLAPFNNKEVQRNKTRFHVEPPSSGKKKRTVRFQPCALRFGVSLFTEVANSHNNFLQKWQIAVFQSWRNLAGQLVSKGRIVITNQVTRAQFFPLVETRRDCFTRFWDYNVTIR